MMQRSLSVGGATTGETTLAFRYLFLFRRVVVSLALVGAVLAWVHQFPALTAALVCVGIGELLEVQLLHQRAALARALADRPQTYGSTSSVTRLNWPHWSQPVIRSATSLMPISL